jgi:hypothetical protein
MSFFEVFAGGPHSATVLEVYSAARAFLAAVIIRLLAGFAAWTAPSCGHPQADEDEDFVLLAVLLRAPCGGQPSPPVGPEYSGLGHST